MNDQIKGLKKYYIVVDKGQDWHLLCKECDEAWSLKKDNTHVGNYLHLLNHARSHTDRK